MIRNESIRQCVPPTIAGMLVCVSTLATTFAEIVDVPADELMLNAPLPPVGNTDLRSMAFGSTDGQVCVLGLERFQLRSLHSTNGGADFSSEVEVAGDDEQPILDFDGVLSSEGRLYVALAIGDPAGGIGVALVHSNDMGRTWTDPFYVVQNGDVSHGLGIFRPTIRIATGPENALGVLFQNGQDMNVYVTVSQDLGVNWSTPVRVSVNEPFFGGDIAIDAVVGVVYTTVIELDPFVGVDRAVVRRSLDFGTTFGPPVYPAANDQHEMLWSRVAVTQSGSVVVATLFWDFADFRAKIGVTRSTDGGQTFDEVVTQPTGGGVSVLPVPVLTTYGDNVFVSYVDAMDRLAILRSASDGTTFFPVVELTGSSVVDDSFFYRQHNLVRTEAGTLAAIWRDRRNRGDDRLDDIFVRVSRDGGANWEPEQQVNNPTTFPASSDWPTLVATGHDDLFALFQDTRLSAGGARDLFGVQLPSATRGITGAHRIDSDMGSAPPNVHEVAVGTDGVDHVYVAFVAVSGGARGDVHVAVSGDGGYSFSAPVLVGDTAGSRLVSDLVIDATPDGWVFLLYFAEPPTGQPRELRFNRSSDFGATWLAEDRVLTVLDQRLAALRGASLSATSGGRVDVTWSDYFEVFLVRSADGGATFVPAETVEGLVPQICSGGDKLAMVWRGEGGYVWGRVGDSGGGALSTPAPLDANVDARVRNRIEIDCTEAGAAIVAWPTTSSDPRVYAASYQGGTWSSPVQVPSPPGMPVGQLWVSYTKESGDAAVLAYQGLNPIKDIFTNVSLDGGASFGPYLQIGGEGQSRPTPNTLRLASDQQNNVWVSWIDSSFYGSTSLFVQRSVNGGATFGQLTRIDRPLPRGVFSNNYGVRSSSSVALSGAGLFAWQGQRNSIAYDALFSADDIDDADRDGVPDDVLVGRIQLCHRPHRTTGRAHTITVNAAAVPAHLAHGDTIGVCGSEAQVGLKKKTHLAEEGPTEFKTGTRWFCNRTGR